MLIYPPELRHSEVITHYLPLGSGQPTTRPGLNKYKMVSVLWFQFKRDRAIDRRFLSRPEDSAHGSPLTEADENRGMLGSFPPMSALP